MSLAVDGVNEGLVHHGSGSLEMTGVDPSALVRFMREAMQEGRKARGSCAPNPPVGCVAVRDQRVIARGHTNPPGQDHAEAMVLRSLPHRLDDISLFVTLEPCSFHGRTPSCARAIAERRPALVYVGMLDPHPRNRGAGIRLLEAAGIPVVVGLSKAEVEMELRPYLQRSEP